MSDNDDMERVITLLKSFKQVISRIEVPQKRMKITPKPAPKSGTWDDNDEHEESPTEETVANNQ
jgi:hypothetical protein